MQVMPYTAKKLSSGLNLKYSKSRLKDDPEYNVILGSAYLDQLLSKYSHSYILTLAAYNAGPSRVTRWIAMYGDPRTSDISSEDWVELIPFKETRNYVQRVMENIQVYEFIENDFKPSDYTLQNNLIHGFSEGANILKPMSKP
jgi:soluble lytic murein transglycosylase